MTDEEIDGELLGEERALRAILKDALAELMSTYWTSHTHRKMQYVATGGVGLKASGLTPT